MSINGMNIADNATSIAVTGGSALAFYPDGQEVSNGVHVAATAVADFRVRPHVTFRNKNPQRKADGSFTNSTRTIVFTYPYLDSVTGHVYYDTITIEHRSNPVIPASNVKNARYCAAQLMSDADTENFNTAGDLS